MDEHKEIDHEKEAEMLALNCIIEQCISSSIPVMQEFERALVSSKEDIFDIQIISGGYTNYSYRISLKRNPSVAVFAKISYPYAIWNIDEKKHFDIQRTASEFELMQIFDEIAPGCAAEPYLCLDVGNDAKLLVTEWVNADEQWAHQMVDGSVDMRIPPKFASALAKLHMCEDFDREFNDSAARSELWEGGFVMVGGAFGGLIQEDPSSTEFPRSGKLASQIGQDTLFRILNIARQNYWESRECLTHGDSHAFNVLVERRHNNNNNNNNNNNIGKQEHHPTQSSAFGINGTMILCDFEMALAGPQGKDMGMFLAFPIACAVAHAMNGNLDATKNLMDTIESVWTTYASTLKAGGKFDDDSIREVFHNAQGWAGFVLLFSYFFFPMHENYVPLDSDHDKKIHRDSMGILGLQLFENFIEESPPSTETANKTTAAAEDDHHSVVLELIQSEIREVAQLCVPAEPSEGHHGSRTQTRKTKQEAKQEKVVTGNL